MSVNLFCLSWHGFGEGLQLLHADFQNLNIDIDFVLLSQGSMTMSYKFSEFAHLCACMDKSEKKVCEAGGTQYPAGVSFFGQVGHMLGWMIFSMSDALK